MELIETAPEDIQEKIKPLENGGFRFSCHPEVPCFTECCRDLNLVLTPYDIVRLKNRLALTSGEFLDRHTDCTYDESRHLPMVYLQMSENERRACPFVSPQGCLIYEDRPSACRIYPIARASRLQRVHGKVLENYFVLRENHCRGFEQQRFWKTEEWLQDQGLEPYYESNDLWMQIVTHPRLRSNPLSQQQQQVFYMASYDCDKFRRMVFNSRFLSLFQISEERVLEIEADESALLRLAFDWMRFSLLGEPVLKSSGSPRSA
jgi:Fe-S-cluster containining protein